MPLFEPGIRIPAFFMLIIPVPAAWVPQKNPVLRPDLCLFNIVMGSDRLYASRHADHFQGGNHRLFTFMTVYPTQAFPGLLFGI
jgi:hypothetical protein